MKHFMTFIICCVVIAFLMICKANAQVYVPDCATSNATLCKVPVIKNNVVIGWTEMHRAAGDITFTPVKQIPDTTTLPYKGQMLNFADTTVLAIKYGKRHHVHTTSTNGLISSRFIAANKQDTIIKRINTRIYKSRHIGFTVLEMVASFICGMVLYFIAILLYLTAGTNDNYKHKHRNH